MLSVSVISLCVCVCVSEHVFSTLHLCSSTRPSFLCGNFQIYSGFIDFFLTNKKKKVFFRISHSFSIGVILTPKDTFVKKKITYLQNDRIKPSFFYMNIDR